MKYSQLKHLLEQGKLDQFQQQLENQTLVPADIDLLLMEAIKNKIKNFQKYFNILIKKGANVNFKHSGGTKKTNLMAACEQGTYDSVDLLCSHPQIDFNILDSTFRTAAYYAIQNKTKTDGQVFLDRILKAAPYLINKHANNQTLLILAIKKQRPELVKILLKYKADPNYIINDSGNTSLHEAIKNCKAKQTRVSKEIVKLLLEYGADHTVKNKKGKDCLEFADKFDLKALLQEIEVKHPQKNIDQKNQNIQRKDYYSPVKSQQPHPTKIKLLELNKENQINDAIKKADQIAFRLKQKYGLFLNERQRTNQSSNDQDNLLSEDDQSLESEEEDEDLQTDANNISPSFVKSETILKSLNQQIEQFSKQCEATYHQTSNQIQRLLMKMKQLANRQNLDMQLYGSFNTGLWLKHCDIDILLIPRQPLNQSYGQYGQHQGQNPAISLENILDKMQSMIRKQPSINIKNCIKNKKIKVPMLRLDIDMSTGNRQKTRKFDMTILDRNHNGLAIAHYINQHVKLYPQLKPLFFTIKSLTYHYKLNDPKNGGIRTYAIIIMILSFLQNLGMNVANYSIAELLLRFLFFFGFEYQFLYGNENDMNMRMNQGQDQDVTQRQPTMLLTIFDPLNHLNNIGKKTKVYELQSMFKSAYIAFHSNIKGKKLQYIFDTKKIMVPF